MSGHRLDEEKLETLRSWGAGLSADGRDELRAAGKAILILVEEIDRLQVDLWRSHDGGAPVVGGEQHEGSIDPAREDSPSPGELEARLDSTLRGRVGRLLGSKPPARRP